MKEIHNQHKSTWTVQTSARASLPSARQHLNYGDCLEVKREYYQNCSVLGCNEQFLQK